MTWRAYGESQPQISHTFPSFTTTNAIISYSTILKLTSHEEGSSGLILQVQSPFSSFYIDNGFALVESRYFTAPTNHEGTIAASIHHLFLTTPKCYGEALWGRSCCLQVQATLSSSSYLGTGIYPSYSGSTRPRVCGSKSLSPDKTASTNHQDTISKRSRLYFLPHQKCTGKIYRVLPASADPVILLFFASRAQRPDKTTPSNQHPSISNLFSL